MSNGGHTLGAEVITIVPKVQSGYRIRRVTVLGAGTMGARIAARIANSGFPVLLLDVPDADGKSPNGVAERALDALRKSRPAAFVDEAATARIVVGNFRDDLDRITTYDWIIEAVVERLDVKQQLLAKVLPYLHPMALLTSNTSGIPLRQIAEKFPEDVRRRWMGTHFFNPPRYMRLFELIPGDETAPSAVSAIADFAELHLGKTVVKVNDTPNFIANRIGVFVMLDTMKIASERGLALEEVDALTGSTLEWPKTATFRLADLVGVDVLAHVARNFAGLKSDERSDVTLPAFVERMVAEGRVGDKVGQGFYTKRGAAGKEQRLALDLSTFDYAPAKDAAFPELASIKDFRDAQTRLRALFAMGPKENRVAEFYWAPLPDLWSYAANRLGEVIESLADIDIAMMAGFNWQLGPFAMWDAAGVENTVASMRAMNKPIPQAVETLLASGGTSWYRADGSEYFDVIQKRYLVVPRSPRELLIEPLRASHTLRGNRSVSLIDLGDGVACLELHSKMNSVWRDSASFLEETLAARGTSDAVRGFVIGTVADHFSALT